MNKMADPEETPLWHQSGVNPDGEPFVQLLLGDKIIAQMSPTLARDHARAITEAAEAAEQDAFMMDFLQRSMELDFETAFKMLMVFRHYRASRTGKSQGPLRPTDWIMPQKPPDYGDFTKKKP